MQLSQRYIACCLLLLSLLACRQETTLFKKLSGSETGIRFANNLSESPDFNVLKYGYFYNGGGVATADFNQDGQLDIYFTGNLSPNRLYLNRGGFSFEDVTEQAGVAAADGWNTGVSIVDINQDKLPDIYVSRSAAESPSLRRNLLFINHGEGKPFTEEAARYGLNDAGYTTQTVFFDYDNDNDLDVFILNHSVQQYAGFSRLIGEFKQQQNENYGSKLLRNDSPSSQEPRFTNVTNESGIKSNVLGFGLGISVADFNNDGWLDMYCSNDYNEEDYYYINQQDGTFKESLRDAMSAVSLFSMGNDAADINNDGYIDLLTLDMLPESNERIKMTSGDDNYDKYKLLTDNGFYYQNMRNMLQINNGNGTFNEVGQLAGISNTDWSWAGLWADIDLDGRKDLFITNGYARDYTNMDFLKFSSELQQSGKQLDVMEIIGKMPQINEPNYLYKNMDGLTFRDMHADWGLSEAVMSNGAVMADLDNDGDLDIITNNVNAEAGIYRNDKISKDKAGKSLRISLNAPNDALKIGAKVMVYADKQTQLQEFMPVRGFQSAHYGDLIFGYKTSVDSVRIIWHDGRTELQKAPAESAVLLTYKEDLSMYHYPKIEQQVVDFKLITQKNVFQNDFKIQPLLPYMIHATGTKTVTGDVTNDGISELFVCGTTTENGRFYGLRSGKLQPLNEIKSFTDLPQSSAALADVDADRDLDLIVTYFNYSGRPDAPSVVLYRNNGNGTFANGSLIYQGVVNPTAIAALDVDGDADLDLFVGGYCRNRSFPEASGTAILRNDGKGNFTETKDFALPDLGLITQAVSEDMNNDGIPELLAAAQFEPVRMISFLNKKATVRDISPAGIWNSIAVADVDKDGIKDVICGNLGLNNQYAATTDSTLSLYTFLPKSGGLPVPVIAVSEEGKTYPFAARDELLDQLPQLKPKYVDYAAYANATVQDIALLLKETYVVRSKENISPLSGICFGGKNGAFMFQPLPAFGQAIAVKSILYDAAQNEIRLFGNSVMSNRVRVGQNSFSTDICFTIDKQKNSRLLPSSWQFPANEMAGAAQVATKPVLIFYENP